MKKIALATVAVIFNLQVLGQISGSTIVCAGYQYNYSVSIAGAISYVWTIPIGWYNLLGQGSSQINVTCNLNDGIITVSGLDINGQSIGSQTLTTEFGASSGWDVSPDTIADCAVETVSQPLFAIPNGTGGGAGCSSGCGSGTLNPNIDYIIYDSPWPGGFYVSHLSGVLLMPLFATTYYVYKVDYTNGYAPNSQAILIEGGCGNATINNAIQMSPFLPLPLTFTQAPSPACIGDTVTVSVNNMVTYSWTDYAGSVLLNNGGNPVDVIVDSLNSFISLIGLDLMSCHNKSGYQIITDDCYVSAPEIRNETSALTISPNPSSDVILIRSNTSHKIILEIFDTAGKRVFENKNFLTAFKFNTSSLSKGIYTVKAGSFVQKFVKL